LWGVLIAHLWLGEVVPLSMSVGGGLIILGTFIHLIGAGDLPHFFQRMMRLLQKQRSSTGMALRRLRYLRLAPFLMLCLIQEWVSRCLSVFHVSVKYLYGSWEERRIRNGDSVWFGKWFFPGRTLREGACTILPLQEGRKRLFGMHPAHPLPLLSLNVRNALFDTSSAPFSFWRSLYLDGSPVLPCLACSQERWRQQPSQSCVPP
jgi:hypothetical protein